MLNANHWLLNAPIAHRGLWNENIIENSVTAYKNAVDNGYPIEIDLYSSADGELFSFHDATLTRMCGVDKKIFELPADEIKKLRLSNTDEHIPTFDEVLAIAENKVPLLIEIKNQPSKEVVKLIVDKLKNYKGEFAVQSFNPLYIWQVKKLAPEFIRGVLATKVDSHLKGNGKFVKYIIKHTSLNFLAKPHFISHDYSGLPLKKFKRKKMPIIAWTVTSQEIYDKIKPFCKNIIFEHFIPKK